MYRNREIYVSGVYCERCIPMMLSWIKDFFDITEEELKEK